uniref:GCR017 n=1 Tax=Schmidtea mediterranea TaxID=79327 RepID=A0A193KU63_SCHMD|nr:GCR017 [Schmidtea mediterranea]
MLNITDKNYSFVNELAYRPLEATLISLSVILLLVLIVAGNSLVLIAISTDYRLKNIQNWFLGSLAIADLLLGILILPFSLFNEIFGRWIFGRLLCSLWLAIDVLLCTASIMHLCLISIDRYYSIVRPIQYKTSRTPNRVLAMIIAAWIISGLICLPPLFGWSSHSLNFSISSNEQKCELTQNRAYVLYSSIGSFYIPLLIIIIVYLQVFIEAKRRANRKYVVKKPEVKKNPELFRKKEVVEVDIEYTEIQQNCNCNQVDSEAISCIVDDDDPSVTNNQEPLNSQKHRIDRIQSKNIISKLAIRKSKLIRYRERRTIVVLGVVVGAFIVCWLPFFTSYLIVIFCKCMNEHLFGFFFWLGYCNSGLNPIIYTVYNRDFRKAFQRILSMIMCSNKYDSRRMIKNFNL